MENEKRKKKKKKENEIINKKWNVAFLRRDTFASNKH